MAVGCKIIRDFPRPARELVERFRGVATSNLVDVMGSCAAIDGALAPIGRGKLLGTAFPARSEKPPASITSTSPGCA